MKKENRRIKCACGCGKPTNIIKKTQKSEKRIKGKYSKFILGHHKIGLETREKMKIARIKQWKNPKYREKIIKSLKKTYQEHPEIIKKQTENRIRTFKQNPNIMKQAGRKGSKTKKKHPEIIEKQKQNLKKTREKHPEILKQMAETQKQRLKDKTNHPLYKKHHKQETIKKIKKARAKQILPIKDTSIEVKIQNFLKQLGIEFFTHQYMKIKHGYQCDILIPSINLVIECDGNYWHKYPVGLEKDHIRTKELIEKGFKVLRLWESEIKEMDVIKFRKKLGLCYSEKLNKNSKNNRFK